VRRPHFARARRQSDRSKGDRSSEADPPWLNRARAAPMPWAQMVESPSGSRPAWVIGGRELTGPSSVSMSGQQVASRPGHRVCGL